jgi:hypothetical protein
VAVAQESEFLAVNQKIRVRIPAVTPLRNRAQGKVVEPSVCKTDLPGASPGCASISKRHNVYGHEEDSNPRRSDRRDTRGSTEVPDHFPIPPKRRKRRTPLVMGRGRRKSGWRISAP